jgi:rhamnose utilization protein RhaD (predicted bifunctional aldolase and dehydrogenase)
MACQWNPSLVSPELLALTLSLGVREKDFAILAEGNTSELVDDNHIVVKASGARMGSATTKDFVLCDVTALVALMDSPQSTQQDLIDALDAGEQDGVRYRGSIETLIHVAVQSLRPTRFVGHTHPTPLVALLASVHQETAFDSFVYSDEAIVIGTTLYVPYAQPGIELGRVFLGALRDYWATHNDLPSLILLGNHGIVALADTADGVEAITEMAYKGAKVRLQALAAGGTTPLSNEAVRGYFEREDMAERRRNLSGV